MMVQLLKVLAVSVMLLLAIAKESSAGLTEALTQVMGIQNCANKCNKVFDRQQYAISDQPDSTTFEYRSCIIGCNECSRILGSQGMTSDVKDDEEPETSGGENVAAVQAEQQGQSCFRFCKTFNYKGRAIRKGVIEPDKACLMGCVINTCQEVCTGGTTDNSITDANRDKWWGQGGPGCSLKGNQGYVQNPAYGNPDAPGGPGAREDLKQCCTNAFNLCYYNGDKNSVNFQQVQYVARKSCTPFINRALLSDDARVCEFYRDPRNCGTVGLGNGNFTGGV